MPNVVIVCPLGKLLAVTSSWGNDQISKLGRSRGTNWRIATFVRPVATNAQNAGAALTQFVQGGGEWLPSATAVSVAERPPMREGRVR